MTFWRTICYCHSRLADRELLFINLDETSVGHTMTPPIGCVAKPRTAGGKQPHAQVLKQHVRGAWTYVSVICNCKHIQGKLPHFLIGTQVKLTKKLLRAQRALPQTRLRVLRQKSAWTSAANSAQILKEIAEVLKSFPSKQGVALLDCAPAHLQVMAMARKCKLQLVYIPAQTTDYLQPLDLQGFSPFKQYLKRKHQELRSYSEHGLVPPLAWLLQCMQAPHEFWAARQWQKSFDAVGCNGPGQVHKALQHLMGAGVPWPGPDRPTPQQMQCVWPARRQMAHAYKALPLRVDPKDLQTWVAL